jgi:chaperonin cofactor prefoldin
MSNFAQNFNDPYFDSSIKRDTDDLIKDILRQISNQITTINQAIIGLDIQSKHNNDKLEKLEGIIQSLQAKAISNDMVIDRLQEVVLEGRTGQTSQIVSIDRLIRDLDLLSTRINKIESSMEKKDDQSKTKRESVWAWVAAIIGSLITALITYLAQYVKFTTPQ